MSSEVVQKLKNLIEQAATVGLSHCKIEVVFQCGRPGIVRCSLDSLVPAGLAFESITKEQLVNALVVELERAVELDLFGSVGLIFTSNMGQLAGVRRVFEETSKIDTSRPVPARR